MDKYKNKHYHSEKVKEEHHSRDRNVRRRRSADRVRAKLEKEKAAVQAEKAKLRAEILERNEIRDRIRQEIEKKQANYSKNMDERRSRYSKKREEDWDKRRGRSGDQEQTFNDERRNENRKPEVESRRDDCRSPNHVRGHLEHQEPGLNRGKNRGQESPRDHRRLDGHCLPHIVREENFHPSRPSERKRKISPSIHVDVPRRQATEPARDRMQSPSRNHHRVTYPRGDHRHDSKGSNRNEIRTKQFSPIQIGEEIHLNSRRDPVIIREPRLDEKKRVRHSSPFESRARSPFREAGEKMHGEKRSHEIQDRRRVKEERPQLIYIDRRPFIKEKDGNDEKFVELDRPSLRPREDERPRHIKNEISGTIKGCVPTYEPRERNRSTLMSEEMRNRQMDDEQPPYMRERSVEEVSGRPLDNDRQVFERGFRSTSMDRPSYSRQETIHNRDSPPRTRESELTKEDQMRRHSPPFEVKTVSNSKPSFTKGEMRGKQIDKVRLHYSREEVSRNRRYSPTPRELKMKIKNRIDPPFKRSRNSMNKELYMEDERRDLHHIPDLRPHDTHTIRKSSPPFRSRPTDDKTSTFHSANDVYLEIREPERLGRYSPLLGQRLIDDDSQNFERVKLRDNSRDIRKLEHHRGPEHSPYAFSEREFMTQELNESARRGQHVRQRRVDDYRSLSYEKDGYSDEANASSSIERIALHETRRPFGHQEEMRITTRVSGINEDFITPTSFSHSGRQTYESSKKEIEANKICPSRIAEPKQSVLETIKPKHYINDQQPPPYIRDHQTNVRSPRRFSPTFGHQEDRTNTRKQPRNREVRLSRNERSAHHGSLHEELHVDKEIASGNRLESEERSWSLRDRRPLEHRPPYDSEEIYSESREMVLIDPALQRKPMEHIPRTHRQRPRDDSLSPNHDHFLAKGDWKIHQLETREPRITGEESDSSTLPYERRLSETNVDIFDADKNDQEDNMAVNRFYLIRQILEGQNWKVAIMRIDREPIDMPLANAIQASMNRKWKETKITLNRDLKYPFFKPVLMTSGYFIVTLKNEEAFNWLLGVNLSIKNARLRIIPESQIARVRVTVCLDGFGKDDPSVPHEPLKNIIFQNDYRKGLHFHLWSLDKFYKTAKCGKLQILIDVDSAVTLKENPYLNFELSNVRVEVPEKIILEPEKGNAKIKLVKYPF